MTRMMTTTTNLYSSKRINYRFGRKQFGTKIKNLKTKTKPKEKRCSHEGRNWKNIMGKKV